jgi:hypothetical protein
MRSPLEEHLRVGAVFQMRPPITPWQGTGCQSCHNDCCAAGLNAVARRICQPPDDRRPLLAGRITTVTGRNPGFRRATAGDDDLRTVPLLDYYRAARLGRRRGEYHKVRSNPMYRGILTWVKPSLGLGNYFRGTTEHVLFGVRRKLKLRCTDIALPTCSTGADEVPARDQS